MTEAPERGPTDPGTGESQQLPEEAPPEQIVDDTAEEGREEARENEGGRGREGRATGHPDDA